MKLWSKLRALFRRRKFDAEMAEEMRLHLELQTERNVAAGMDPDEARHAARRKFGGVEQLKEQCRDQRRWVWLEQTIQDFRYGVRALRRAPGFTFAVVATLTVGVGLVTAVVNVAQPILLPELPYHEADRLVMLRERSPRSPTVLLPYRFSEYARHSTSFSALGAEKVDRVNLVVRDAAFAVRVSSVTGGFFAAFRVDCSQGRLFAAEDYVSGHAGSTVILSDGAWKKFFQSAPNVVGQDIAVGERMRRVIGILSPQFVFRGTPISSTDGIYISAPLETSLRPGFSNVNAIARLKPGVTIEQAEAELRTIRPEMPPRSAEMFSTIEPYLSTLADVFRENRVQPFWIFLGAAALLHLIGCTTIANLMLSRAVGRRRELAVRVALGGTQVRVVRLIVMESLVLGLLGASAGAVLAVWAQQLTAHLAPRGITASELFQHADSVRTFGIALALGISTCVFSMLVPAWRASRIELAEGLKQGAGALGDTRRIRVLRESFVVVQSALAVALLIGAGLLIRTVSRLQHIEPGFDPARKILLTGARTGKVDRERLEAHNTALVEQLGALPGVAKAAFTTTVPAGGNSFVSSGFTIEGQRDPTPLEYNSFVVAGDYFEAMEMPLIAGQGFAGMRRGDRSVAVINDAMARDHFASENPVGRFLISGEERIEIVGVVRSVAHSFRGMPVWGKGGAISAQIYTPVWQTAPSEEFNAIVRLHTEPDSGFEASVRRVFFGVDPSIVVRILPLDDLINEWSRTERQSLVMLQVLSCLALSLAAFGTFSVSAYSVAQRQSEFGLRLVLGATPRKLMEFVLRRGLWLGGLGIGVGIGAAFALSRFLQVVLFETSPHDPIVYVAVALLLFITTAVACWLPARRAAKVDPMVALRCE